MTNSTDDINYISDRLKAELATPFPFGNDTRFRLYLESKEACEELVAFASAFEGMPADLEITTCRCRDFGQPAWGSGYGHAPDFFAVTMTSEENGILKECAALDAEHPVFARLEAELKALRERRAG